MHRSERATDETLQRRHTRQNHPGTQSGTPTSSSAPAHLRMRLVGGVLRRYQRRLHQHGLSFRHRPVQPYGPQCPQCR